MRRLNKGCTRQLTATGQLLWSADAPLFLRHLDGESFISDENGLELADTDAAKLEAQRALPDMARDALPNGNFRSFVVNIRDETGQAVIRLALSLVVEEGTLDDELSS
jgi:hypothetical protein